MIKPVYLVLCSDYDFCDFGMFGALDTAVEYAAARQNEGGDWGVCEVAGCFYVARDGGEWRAVVEMDGITYGWSIYYNQGTVELAIADMIGTAGQIM